MKINSESELRKLYNSPSERAVKKELTELDSHCINFIQKSPFLVLSTTDKNNNIDASPRGGVKGFVHVIDEKIIVIPDSKGNNRLDSLTNIIETGKVGILFLIPGIDETLRVNGSAYITNNEDLLAHFSSEKNPPKTCIHVTVEVAFLHCAKALMRSKLWDETNKIERKDFPTMGQMLKDQIGMKEPAESQEDMIKRYQPDL